MVPVSCAGRVRRSAGTAGWLTAAFLEDSLLEPTSKPPTPNCTHAAKEPFPSCPHQPELPNSRVQSPTQPCRDMLSTSTGHVHLSNGSQDTSPTHPSLLHPYIPVTLSQPLLPTTIPIPSSAAQKHQSPIRWKCQSHL